MKQTDGHLSCESILQFLGSNLTINCLNLQILMLFFSLWTYVYVTATLIILWILTFISLFFSCYGCWTCAGMEIVSILKTYQSTLKGNLLTEDKNSCTRNSCLRNNYFNVGPCSMEISTEEKCKQQSRERSLFSKKERRKRATRSIGIIYCCVKLSPILVQQILC